MNLVKIETLRAVLPIVIGAIIPCFFLALYLGSCLGRIRALKVKRDQAFEALWRSLGQLWDASRELSAGREVRMEAVRAELAAAGRVYNASCAEYEAALRRFPASWLVILVGHRPRDPARFWPGTDGPS